MLLVVTVAYNDAACCFRFRLAKVHLVSKASFFRSTSSSIVEAGAIFFVFSSTSIFTGEAVSANVG